MPNKLDPRKQRRILRLHARGWMIKRIARELEIAPMTVRTCLLSVRITQKCPPVYPTQMTFNDHDLNFICPNPKTATEAPQPVVIRKRIPSKLSREAQKLWDNSEEYLNTMIGTVMPLLAWGNCCNWNTEAVEEFLSTTESLSKDWVSSRSPSPEGSSAAKYYPFGIDDFFGAIGTQTAFLFPQLTPSERALLSIAATNAQYLSSIVNIREISEQLITEGEIDHLSLTRMIESEVIPLLSPVQEKVVREYYLKIRFIDRD